IAEGIEGLIQNNELPPDAKPRKGDMLKAEVSNVDSMDRRITMSARDVGQTPATDQSGAVKRESSAGGKGGTLGDLFREKFGDRLKNLAAPGEEEAAEEQNEES